MGSRRIATPATLSVTGKAEGQAARGSPGPSSSSSPFCRSKLQAEEASGRRSRETKPEPGLEAADSRVLTLSPRHPNPHWQSLASALCCVPQVPRTGRARSRGIRAMVLRQGGWEVSCWALPGAGEAGPPAPSTPAPTVRIWDLVSEADSSLEEQGQNGYSRPGVGQRVVACSHTGPHLALGVTDRGWPLPGPGVLCVGHGAGDSDPRPRYRPAGWLPSEVTLESSPQPCWPDCEPGAPPARPVHTSRTLAPAAGDRNGCSEVGVATFPQAVPSGQYASRGKAMAWGVSAPRGSVDPSLVAPDLSFAYNEMLWGNETCAHGRAAKSAGRQRALWAPEGRPDACLSPTPPRH